MSFEIKRLKEERAKLVRGWRVILEQAEKENRGLNTDEQVASDKAEADLKLYDERVDRLERAEAAAAKIAAVTIAEGQERAESPQNTPESRVMALQGWMLAQAELPIGDAQRQAMQACGVRPNQRFFDIGLRRTSEYNAFRREQRAGMSTTDALGGYTIPEGFVSNFETALLAFGGPRQVADVIRTASGNDLPWPTGNDTSNKGELLTEETTIGVTTNPTIGAKIFGAYKMSSKLIQVSPELLQDSAFDMASQIGAWLGERIGRIECDYYTTGTGSSQPTGILATSGGATAATLSTGNAYTASASAITPDEIMDLIHAVDPAYRMGSAFMMKDSTVLALRKLKDGNGAYIWVPGLQAGQSDTLFGYPVVVNQSMAAITNSAKAVVFGQFSKFKIRDVAEIRLRRLVERYADTDQEGFVAFHRTDSGLLDAGTHPVKYLAMHA
jgi:HK97 family phage major capsid protein